MTPNTILMISVPDSLTVRMQYCNADKYIVTCRVVQVKKITGSRLDDWISYHFSYKFF
jgi:hypothetical protein